MDRPGGRSHGGCDLLALSGLCAGFPKSGTPKGNGDKDAPVWEKVGWSGTANPLHQSILFEFVLSKGYEFPYKNFAERH